MARLKNVNNGVPGGFRFRQPQINPKWELSIHGRSSIRQAVEEVYNVRRANPALTKQHNLSLDKQVIQDEIDQFTAEGLAKAGGRYDSYLAPVVAAQFDFPKSWPSQQRLTNVAAAAGGVKRTAAGIKLVMDWLGSGLKPVDKTLAEARAGVCVKCKHNSNPNWLQTIDALVAKQIKSLIEVKNDLKLSTSSDSKLMTCVLCDCALTLKVHAPIDHIWSNTSDELKKKLSDAKTSDGKQCWVITESSKL